MEIVLDRVDELGEGPTWDPMRGELLWVDVIQNRVHRLDPVTERLESIEFDRHITAVVPRADGGYLIALWNALAVVDAWAGNVQILMDVETDRPGNRVNDGKCDSRGRFWFGTVEGEESESASVYRLDSSHRLTHVLGDVRLSNGIGWSPDDSTMYYVDTLRHRIDAFDYQAEAGTVSRRRSVAETRDGWGITDRLTVDVDGYIWVGFWEGWCVRRFAPDGTVDRKVRLPVARVTSCAFGGADLADLYITTARPETESDGMEQPHAGSLFRVRPGVRGLRAHPFTG